MSKRPLTVQTARECVYAILDVNRAIASKFIDERVRLNDFKSAADIQLTQQKSQDELRDVLVKIDDLQAVKNVFSDMYGITVSVLNELKMPIPSMLQLAKICIERK
jgi:myosin-crossreactive antigen